MSILAGRYEIIEQLGGGGFAITYLAKDKLQPSEPQCVVKQLYPHQNNSRVLEFFRNEAVILEKLGKHPQIPQLLAHFSENENFYIVQEFIEGQDLGREIIPGNQLSEGYVIKLLRDVLEALSFVHSQGVIHRDIKPQNLMRRLTDGKICLIDFGAVKEISSLIVNSQGVITSSVVIGSFGYMPREQTSGKPILASDIYALGITAIQALTGLAPTELEEDPQTGEIIWRHKVQANDCLADILSKMVRRHFSLRYPSALPALQDVQGLSSLPGATLPPTPAFSDSRQAYFDETLNRLQEGQSQFSVFALKILESKRAELGLSEEEAQEIQDEVLRPYREYERKLQEYEQALIVAISQQYPFSQATEKDLQDYRQYLGLKDQDIAAVEERVMSPQKPENRIPLKDTELLVPEPKRKPSQSHSASTPKSPLPPTIETQSFEFETAILTLKSGNFLGLGKSWEIQRSRRTTRFFTEDLGRGVILQMVVIPDGNFLMGSPDSEIERSRDEGPQHAVTIKPFFMGKFPVTQAQWQAISALPKVQIDLNPDPSYFKGANRPVENVSWIEAREFCARLSKKAGKNYCLPTEAEWEYACRAGTTTPFYFGESITTDLANYNGNHIYSSEPKSQYREQTTDVGILPANAFGLYDMSGNIWEWCEDEWHSNYIGAPVDGSARVSNNHNQLLRGGSWYDYPKFCRSSSRIKFARDYRDSLVGFRVVCTTFRK
ncbi:bifunctional serine/threonine-protein kinase/formylglycine-generating enzyme family protein [Cronbergia sp. UHCC 0137]|uniref:bifunctional serine/threonine-protein kinase/formylglycine-generating enzyme family protein n=1 Tax=Cronbergia sp. UHCC 0137 TaxID=3110239 RepID=UPI002B210351|nr:bifunctional serine/threonine-protein kinase/formylglycine-generating enzyme family protein [Cronbergia sp. UHCC 0137]MEA5618368.1 bifunctional serine/threonine-protein kinase/formylglycine-generating enzyme family protein [Cronbergia sp. UHCC 0137]